MRDLASDAQGDLDTARRHGLQALHHLGAPLPSDAPARRPVFSRILSLVLCRPALTDEQTLTDRCLPAVHIDGAEARRTCVHVSYNL